MDQIKIGNFISECRKNKKMTQEQLAEKLGVTSKSVSRWENGNTMPDYSLLKDLCNELDINVNELLSGEKIRESDYMIKAEENFIKFTELMSFKSMKYGIIGMCIAFIILILISTYKNMNPAPLVSLICAYNSVTFISRYKLTSEKSNLLPGVMFGLAMVLNTLAFILK